MTSAGIPLKSMSRTASPLAGTSSQRHSFPTHGRRAETESGPATSFERRRSDPDASPMKGRRDRATSTCSKYATRAPGSHVAPASRETASNPGPGEATAGAPEHSTVDAVTRVAGNGAVVALNTCVVPAAGGSTRHSTSVAPAKKPDPKTVTLVPPSSASAFGEALSSTAVLGSSAAATAASRRTRCSRDIALKIEWSGHMRTKAALNCPYIANQIIIII